ncbi:hypothetical protein RN001_000115 [Aquatica leii]|uniref:Uncharacterized protein n=1 Tax=Aquatica leii TaxID=1421715 RepID=A0AAN7SKB4_9COLE|nr:hypothetical protein RN001_000115 [Aquatica leii]
MNIHVIILISIASCNALLEVPLDIRQSWEDLIERFSSQCICEVGVSPALAVGFFKKGQYSADFCTHCYVYCVSEKLNLISASTGVVNQNEFLRQVAGTTPPMVLNCSIDANSKKDRCDVGYYMYQCIVTALLVPI